MEDIISVQKLNKSIGKKKILNDINFSVKKGEIIGVIGTNGAGKTTLLKSLLGLSQYEGDITVCGLNPKKQQAALMKEVSFIADTATLPEWLTCQQLFDYMTTMHENFDRSTAEQFISQTNITSKMKIKTMSKGMVTQLHLALVMAIDSTLLVLDEPTLGLDIIRRKAFYNSLLDDYFDEDNTIIITTHQIEEIERILTRVIFIEQGNVIADLTLDDIEQRYLKITVTAEHQPLVVAMKPIYQQKIMGSSSYLFDRMNLSEHDLSQLKAHGTLGMPELSDLFIALSQINTNSLNVEQSRQAVINTKDGSKNKETPYV